MLEAVLGAIAGAAWTYLFQQVRERSRKHRQALRKMATILERMTRNIHYIYDDDTRERWSVGEPSEQGAVELMSDARKLMSILPNVRTSSLRQRVASCVYGSHSTREELVQSFTDVYVDIRKEAYPSVHSAKEAVQNHKWLGPGHMGFRRQVMEFENTGDARQTWRTTPVEV